MVDDLWPEGSVRAVLLGALLFPAIAQAQGTASEPPKFEVGVRGIYLPLYQGDATVGAVHGWGGSVHASAYVGVHGRSRLEAFYTLSPMNEDPSTRAPQVQFAGLLFTRRWPPSSASRIAPFVSGGAGLVSIEAREVVCEPPCLAEGGPSFRDATLPTLVVGAGSELAVGRGFSVRLDTKLHWPVGDGNGTAGGSADPRLEFGAGMSYGF